MPGEEEPVWLSCPECVAPCRDRALSARSELHCRRCGARVKRVGNPATFQAALAISTAGLILSVLANVDPILTFDVYGNAQSTWIITGVGALCYQGYWPVAVLVFFSAIAGPLLHLGTVWYVSGGCLLGRPWPRLLKVAKLAESLAIWNLVPVYAVAIMVAVVKLEMLGDVHWRRGALWVLALSICSLVTMQMFDHQAVEDRVAAFPV